MIQNSKPIGLPKYSVGQIHHAISCDSAGPRIHREVIEGIIWVEKSWCYIIDTEFITERIKKCNELACDDPCCDIITITDHYLVSENQVIIDETEAANKAQKFFESQQIFRKRILENPSSLVDKRYHK